MFAGLVRRMAVWGLIVGGSVCPLAAAQAAGIAALEAAPQVDALLAEELFASASVQLAPATDDQTYLRRITLDLVGRLPSPGDVTAFVLDPAADKRARAVDDLLARPEFGQNWGRYFRDVIFYRRSDDRALLAAGAAEDFFAQALNANQSWGEIARACITATGDVTQNGATAIFIAQMGVQEDVAAETSRIFLGVQISCAQCHDHPTDRWVRQQFHELAAFFPRVVIRPKRDAMGRAFEVLGVDREVGRGRGMGQFRRPQLEHRMPDKSDPSAPGAVMQPVLFTSGQSLATGISDAERRSTLADWLTSRENDWFARAFVNRMWAELVGEGFYEPVDDLGPDRTPVAPATIEFLAEQFTATNYDVKWLFRTILATQAYQRQSRARREADEVPFTANVAQPLRADQLYDSLVAALAFNERAMQQLGRQGGGGLARLAGPRGTINAQFGFDPSLPRSEVEMSIPQALVLMNAPLINQALSARGPDSVLGRLLAQLQENEDLVAELYLRTLAREPSAEELAVCLSHVEATADRAAAFEDLFWALLNSTEFVIRR